MSNDNYFALVQFLGYVLKTRLQAGVCVVLYFIKGNIFFYCLVFNKRANAHNKNGFKWFAFVQMCVDISYGSMRTTIGRPFNNNNDDDDCVWTKK